MKFFIRCLFIFLITLPAFGFNWSKCEQSFWKTKGVGWESKVFMSLSNHSTSSAQYISSTGDCAMIGQIENDKRVFVADNLDKMKDNFAKGNGEYSNSFAQMHGCNLENQKYYSKLMKKNWNGFVQIELRDKSDEVYQYLESHFLNNKVLKTKCISNGSDV